MIGRPPILLSSAERILRIKAVIRPGAALEVAGVGFGCFLFAAAHVGVRRTRLARVPSGTGLLAVPQRGYVSEDLLKQGLSHHVFHERRAKSPLAAIVEPEDGTKGAVVVVGVEFGAEVVMFARDWCIVHVFVPVPSNLNVMTAKVQKDSAAVVDGSDRRWDIRLCHIAAGVEANGTVALKYRMKKADDEMTVRERWIDDYLRRDLIVLSPGFYPKTSLTFC